MDGWRTENRKIDGLILDVDGTLWDSTPIVAVAWNRAIRECGITDVTVTADMLKNLFGKTMEVIAREMLPGTDERTRERVMEICCRYEDEALLENERDICYPGVAGGIRALAKRLPVFIVSNCQSGYIELFLEKSGLTSAVRDIECYGNTGEGKAANIRRVAARNGLRHPVYVGDTQGDCDAAAEAGVPFVFASYGFGRPERMDARISEFSDLLTLIQEEDDR